MARRLVAKGNTDERVELTCDACGQTEDVDVEVERPGSGDEATAQLPPGWRADSRYDYCPRCGPSRIRTMDELEAEAKVAKPR